MNIKLNVGVIGLGRLGSVYAKHLAYRVPNAKLIAVSDIKNGVAESFAKENSIPKWYKSHEELLLDKEDLVQKGYGWMLKEASNIYPMVVFKYVMKHKDVMPRTALRYAIEKMPKDWKKRAMS